MKKLTELELTGSEVDYVYVKKHLETHVCFFYLFIYLFIYLFKHAPLPMFAYVYACRRTPLEIHFIY